jgi:hypothetical protein
VRTGLKAGDGADREWKIAINHNEVLQTRSALKAGGHNLNHNETLRVRSTLKAGGEHLNHNETLQTRN